MDPWVSAAAPLASTRARRLLKWKNITKIMLWPIFAALLIPAIWSLTHWKIDEEREAAHQAVLKQATAYANSYSDQLSHTVQQIDQTVLNLKYDWEDPDTLVNLEKKRLHGLFPNSTLLYATIVDANGTPITSTLYASGARPNFSSTEFFQQQKAGCCTGLLISRPDLGMQLHRPVIRFSRRINTPDGTFSGVAFLSVEPSYLMSFQDEGLSHNDFVSVRLTTGALLVSRLGRNSQPTVQRYYRGVPQFPTDAGVTIEPAGKFTDGKARIVAWKKLQNYPLIALAALSEQDAYAPLRERERNHRETAAIGSLLLVLLAIVGTVFSMRLGWRRQREEETRETYRLATDAANEGFFMIRPVRGRNDEVVDFQLEDCNEHGAALIGKSRNNLIRTRVSQLKPKQFQDEMLALCKHTLEHGLYENEHRVTQPSPIRAHWIYRRMVRSSSGLAFTVRDISEAKDHEEALSNLANSDALTKLPNRRWLADFLPTAVKRAEHGNENLAVLFIDLDNFKNINDTLGHEAGDELLQQAAFRLKKAVRASDHVVRLGGDEFTVVLEHIEGIDDISRIGKVIVKALAEPFTLNAGMGNHVNASIGISVYPQDGKDGETLLKHADIAMYAAKAAGKGRYHFYQENLSEELLLRLNKERSLRHAVEQDEFVIHYQPRVGVNTGQLSSMEALVRWMPPGSGTIVYPTEFIDLAEDIGLIVRLGELVIEKVCAQLANWKAQGLDLLPVSINVSPQQLKHGNISSFIASCLSRYGIDASLIEVELTESAVIDKSQSVSNELVELRRLGVKLMIDDFGTGYSSLAQLHRIDVDVLKVDQEFTRALSNGREGQMLFRAILSMADALGMCVVAEGVETSEQLDVLRSLSCDEIQGYFISKAIAASEISRFMLNRDLLPASGAPGHIASL